MRKGSKFVAFLLCISCLLGGIYIGAHYTGRQVSDAAEYQPPYITNDKLGEETWEAFQRYNAMFANPTPTQSLFELLAEATLSPTATRPLRTARPYGDRVHYVTAGPATATPKPTPKPTTTPRIVSLSYARAAAGVATAAPPKVQIVSWVIGESANVRKGPSTDYAVVEKLYYGDKLYALELVETSAGKWVRVQTESGKTGYASIKLLSNHDPGAPSSNNNSNRGQTNRQTQNQSQSRTVYVSRTGECYHSYSGCSDMVNPLVMSEDEAIARGRRRCKKCW